jgi:hypothetical protein
MKNAARIKLKCVSITKRVAFRDTPVTYDANFKVIPGDSEENKVYFAEVPDGSITLNTINENVFELGAEYYITLIQADAITPIFRSTE